VTQEESARNWERAFLERKGRKAVDQYGRTWSYGTDEDAEPGDPYRTYPARGEQRREDEA